MKFERVFVCVSCRKPKPESLGLLKTKRLRYNSKYFICANCLSAAPVARLERRNYETPPEKQVRLSLSELRKFIPGLSVKAEYRIGPFIYDFAVPALRLLIEVDSKAYHRFARQLKRDRAKTRLASKLHWKLVRLRVSPEVGLAAFEAALDRARELGF